MRSRIILLCGIGLLWTASLQVPGGEAAGYPPLTISYSTVGMSYVMPWIGIEEGLYKKHGLETRLVLLRGSRTTVQVLVSGDAPITYSGAAPILQAGMKGADTVIVSANRRGLQHSFVAHPEIQTPQDLRGKAIGVLSLGGSSDYYTRVLLQKWGIPENQVAIVQTGGWTETLVAIQRKRIYGGLVTFPEKIIAKRMGLRELVNLSKDHLVPFESGSIATTRKYLAMNRSIVKGALLTHVEATQIYKSNPELAIRITSKYLRTTDLDLLREGYKDQLPTFQDIPYPWREGIQAVLDQIGSAPGQNKVPSADEFIDLSILREIEESGFVQQIIRRSK